MKWCDKAKDYYAKHGHLIIAGLVPKRIGSKVIHVRCLEREVLRLPQPLTVTADARSIDYYLQFGHEIVGVRGDSYYSPSGVNIGDCEHFYYRVEL